ncbi:arylalkylamine N-acetyltransferase-like 2 [Musca domestica]|uniref:Arylalkylamine N-acetyltransferase-like 2 n=1 Tax=Musca domestica TaxID=7370 RepID=A0ABM3UQT7_MUSDO|nr:arylalkylamine N-acetyltransferase-like 2 [Musca domestica]
MAVHKPSNKIIGACIAGPQGVDEADQLFEAAAVKAIPNGENFKTIACIERDAKDGQHYGVERILDIVGTCVDRSMRGRNIASRFYDFLRDLGKAKGYQLLRADCSSFYSARIKEQQGWDCINTIVYKEYLDENGEPVFDLPPPHEDDDDDDGGGDDGNDDDNEKKHHNNNNNNNKNGSNKQRISIALIY